MNTMGSPPATEVTSSTSPAMAPGDGDLTSADDRGVGEACAGRGLARAAAPAGASANIRGPSPLQEHTSGPAVPPLPSWSRARRPQSKDAGAFQYFPPRHPRRSQFEYGNVPCWRRFTGGSTSTLKLTPACSRAAASADCLADRVTARRRSAAFTTSTGARGRAQEDPELVAAEADPSASCISSPIRSSPPGAVLEALHRQRGRAQDGIAELAHASERRVTAGRASRGSSSAAAGSVLCRAPPGGHLRACCPLRPQLLSL